MELVPGKKAPPFRIPRLDGGEPIEFGDDPLTLLVFKESCPTCRWAMPYFERLHRNARSGSLRVVGVAEDEPDVARAFAAELELTLPIAVEPAPYETSEAFGLVTVPTFFLVDGQREILLTSPGFARDDLQEVAQRSADQDGGEPARFAAEGEEVPAFRPG